MTNPNDLFRTLKSLPGPATPPQIEATHWECFTCGYIRTIGGLNVETAIQYLDENSYCNQCGEANPGWTLLD